MAAGSARAAFCCLPPRAHQVPCPAPNPGEQPKVHAQIKRSNTQGQPVHLQAGTYTTSLSTTLRPGGSLVATSPTYSKRKPKSFCKNRDQNTSFSDGQQGQPRSPDSSTPPALGEAKGQPCQGTAGTGCTCTCSQRRHTCSQHFTPKSGLGGGGQGAEGTWGLVPEQTPRLVGRQDVGRLDRLSAAPFCAQSGLSWHRQLGQHTHTLRLNTYRLFAGTGGQRPHSHLVCHSVTDSQKGWTPLMPGLPATSLTGILPCLCQWMATGLARSSASLTGQGLSLLTPD